MKIWNEEYGQTIDFKEDSFIPTYIDSSKHMEGYATGEDEEGNEYTVDCESDGVSLFALNLDSIEPVREYVN